MASSEKYMVMMYQTDYYITDKGFDLPGRHRLSPAEAARINQEAQDIMDGKKDIHIDEGMDDSEVFEPW